MEDNYRDENFYRPPQGIAEALKTFDMSRFTSIKKEEHHEYAHYVNLTAKMLYGTKPGKKVAEVCKNPGGYMVVHRIFEKENWTLERIRRYYLNATKHNGNMPSNVYWWWQRKKENQR